MAFARFEKKASIFTAKSRVADGPCMVGMEASGGAHFWARQRAAVGHEIHINKLIVNDTVA